MTITSIAHRMTRFATWRSVSRIGTLALVLTMPLHATMDAGLVVTPEGAVAPGDFLMAVYADGLYPDPLDPQAPALLAATRARPLGGCLSVARLRVGSDAAALQAPATLTFSCDNVPDSAQVFGWNEGAWETVPSIRTPGGRLKVRFQRLTTYAIFMSPPAALRRKSS